jgi:hypothetical protein
MATYAIVRNGVVENVIEWDESSDWTAPDGAESVRILSGQIPMIGGGVDVTTPSEAELLASAQESQKAAVDGAYALCVSADIEFKTASGVAKTFQADAGSQMVLMQATQGYRIAGAVPPNFFWKAADNTLVAFALADLEGLYVTVLGRGWAAFQKRATLKAEIDAATTVEAVQAIEWAS